MRRFRSFNHSTCKTVRKIVVERVTVVKFRVDNKGSDGTGCFRIKVRTDTADTARQGWLKPHIYYYTAYEN